MKSPSPLDAPVVDYKVSNKVMFCLGCWIVILSGFIFEIMVAVSIITQSVSYLFIGEALFVVFGSIGGLLSFKNRNIISDDISVS